MQDDELSAFETGRGQHQIIKVGNGPRGRAQNNTGIKTARRLQAVRFQTSGASGYSHSLSFSIFFANHWHLQL
jgi:hypothetical protein